MQIALGSARRASDHVAQGATSMLLVENKDGMVLLAPLAKGFILALVADSSAMLGAVRFESCDRAALQVCAHDIDQAKRGKTPRLCDQPDLGAKGVSTPDKLRRRPGMKTELVDDRDFSRGVHSFTPEMIN